MDDHIKSSHPVGGILAIGSGMLGILPLMVAPGFIEASFYGRLRVVRIVAAGTVVACGMLLWMLFVDWLGRRLCPEKWGGRRWGRFVAYAVGSLASGGVSAWIASLPTVEDVEAGFF